MKYWTILPLVFLLISCQKEEEALDVQNIDSLKKNIVGEWNWDYSINPWTEDILTPQTENYIERLSFQSNSTLQIFKNDTLEKETTWDIKKRPTDILNPGQDSIIFIIIDDKPDFFELSKTTLRINQTPYDGFDKYYKKST